MKSDVEIRDEAWRLLWKRYWFWKVLGASFLINMCVQAVSGMVNQVVIQFNVISIVGLKGFLADNPFVGLSPKPEITPVLVTQVLVSILIIMLIGVVARGIADYGTACVLLRATDDSREDWIGPVFSGVKRPFQLAWLMFRMMLAYAVWAVPAALPIGMTMMFMEEAITTIRTPADAMPYVIALMASMTLFTAVLCIPFYKYRYLFRIKADHPDWTAGQCMRYCADLVRGHKWRCFVHDCSYWKIFLLPLAAIMVIALALAVVVPLAASGSLPESQLAVTILACVLGGFLLYAAAIASFAVCAIYISVGQTLLYRELARGSVQPDDAQPEPAR